MTRNRYRGWRGIALVMLPLAAAGCARIARHGERPERPVLVTVNEPAGGPDEFIAPQPIAEESAGRDLLLGAARRVANDGRWSHVRWSDDLWARPWSCRAMPFTADRDPLADRGAYRLFDDQWPDRSWIVIGLGLGGDGGSPTLFAAPCEQGTWAEAGEARIARLAPALTGRDTSLLFTRTRRGVAGTTGQAGLTGLAGLLVDAVLPHREPNGQEPRVAKPRATEGAVATGAGRTAGSRTEAAREQSPARTSADRSTTQSRTSRRP